MNEAFDLDWTFQSETVVHDEGVKIDYIETTNSVLDVIAPELPSLTEPIRVNRIVEMDPGLQGTVLMEDETGIPFLISESSRGMGVLMVLATAIDLDWTSLPAKPLMVPLIQECLRGGIQKGIERRSLMLGETDWRDRVDSTSDDLTHTDGSFIAIDDPDSTIDLSGFWTHRSAVGNEKSVIAVNVNPESGDTDVHSPDSIREWMGGTGDWLIIGEDEEEESGGNGSSGSFSSSSPCCILRKRPCENVQSTGPDGITPDRISTEPMIDWLFKFDSVPQGDSISLGWIHPWSPWIWLVVIVLSAIFSVWCYRRNKGSGLWRFALPLNRFLILTLVALIINGPVVESIRQNRTPDQVIVMIDKSGSMETADIDDPLSSRISRHDHVMNMLETIESDLRTMSEDRTLRWFGFHGHAYEIKPGK